MSKELIKVLFLVLLLKTVFVSSKKMVYEEPGLEADTSYDIGGLFGDLFGSSNDSGPSRGDIFYSNGLSADDGFNYYDDNLFDGLENQTKPWANTTESEVDDLKFHEANKTSTDKCSSSKSEEMLSEILEKLEESEKKNDKACPVSVVLVDILRTLGNMNDEIHNLREERGKNCNSSAVEDEGGILSGLNFDKWNIFGGGDDEEVLEEEEEEEESFTSSPESNSTSTTSAATSTARGLTTPVPPSSCPPPFQLLASGCYFIQTDAREWKSWGDAHAFCQAQGGSLAAPWDLGALQEYLEGSFSNIFWVGARYSEDLGWIWVGDRRPFDVSFWRKGRPIHEASRSCVYLDHWHLYQAVNSFCGEKFSFICQHRGE